MTQVWEATQGKSWEESIWYSLLWILVNKLTTPFEHIICELLWTHLPAVPKELNQLGSTLNCSAIPTWLAQQDKRLAEQFSSHKSPCSESLCNRRVSFPHLFIGHISLLTWGTRLVAEIKVHWISLTCTAHSGMSHNSQEIHTVLITEHFCRDCCKSTQEQDSQTTQDERIANLTVRCKCDSSEGHFKDSYFCCKVDLFTVQAFSPHSAWWDVYF